MDSNDLALLEKLGVEGVLAEMAKGEGRLGRPGSPIREEISHWLTAKMLAREAESSTRSEARAEESLSISRSALDNSRLAARIAISAIVLSIIMATYEIVKWYSSN